MVSRRRRSTRSHKDEEAVDEPVEASAEEDEPEEEEDPEDPEVEPYDEEPTPRRRGRPPGSKNKSTIARELGLSPSMVDAELMAQHQHHPLDMPTPRRRGRPAKGTTPLGGRGRLRSGPTTLTNIPLDANGNPQKIANDELALEEDPQGEMKVTKEGELLGGREYRVRTFTVKGRGARLYMLSTEPARCMGFRDSYLLFQKHRNLFKIIVDEDEKYDLIDRDLIPHSYKGRAIGIVTARSVFREFGARIVVGGRKVADDYYEKRAREMGNIPGELADPEDKLPPEGTPYNKNQYVAWHGASAVYHQYNAPVATRDAFREMAMAVKRRKVVLTDDNWMFEHAQAVSAYNSSLALKRRRTYAGAYDGHTGIALFPKATQPSTVRWAKLEPLEGAKVVVETVLRTADPRIQTGLKNVPEELFEHLPEDTKLAIRAQQQAERAWDAL